MQIYRGFGMELKLSITVEEALERIASSMDEHKPFWQFRYHGDKLFIGRIRGNRFTVSKVCFQRNIPTVVGSVHRTDSGCTVEVKPMPRISAKVFMMFWLAFTVVFMIFGFLYFYKNYLAHSLDSTAYMAFFVPLSMLLFGVFLSRFTIKFLKREELALMEDIVKLLGDAQREQ